MRLGSVIFRMVQVGMGRLKLRDLVVFGSLGASNTCLKPTLPTTGARRCAPSTASAAVNCNLPIVPAIAPVRRGRSIVASPTAIVVCAVGCSAPNYSDRNKRRRGLVLLLNHRLTIKGADATAGKLTQDLLLKYRITAFEIGPAKIDFRNALRVLLKFSWRRCRATSKHERNQRDGPRPRSADTAQDYTPQFTPSRSCHSRSLCGEFLKILVTIRRWTPLECARSYPDLLAGADCSHVALLALQWNHGRIS